MKANSAHLKVEAYGISDIGLARANNEDFFLIDKDAKVFILTDGMGGHNAGEIAAEEAAILVREKIQDLILDVNPPVFDDVIFSLKDSIVHANQHVYLRSKSHPSLKGMGTTLCCIMLFGSQLIFAHVGDSRVYRYRNVLTKLTKDHSLRSKMMDLKETSPFLNKPKWGRNVVTRSIGTSPKVSPEIGWEEAQPGDIYFLCSDGLTDYVPENIISKVLSTYEDLQEACEKLVEIAKKFGGRDNITVLITRFLDKNQ